MEDEKGVSTIVWIQKLSKRKKKRLSTGNRGGKQKIHENK